MLKEFKDFALKSNFLDMATGIVIGGAIGTVVKSLVEDIIMPPIGLMLGGIDFSDLALSLGAGPDGKDVLIKYGSFINNLISFLIVLFAIFMLIKAYNRAKENMLASPDEDAPVTQETLLTEIRDLLKK